MTSGTPEQSGGTLADGRWPHGVCALSILASPRKSTSALVISLIKLCAHSFSPNEDLATTTGGGAGILTLEFPPRVIGGVKSATQALPLVISLTTLAVPSRSPNEEGGDVTTTSCPILGSLTPLEFFSSFHMFRELESDDLVSRCFASSPFAPAMGPR